MAECILAQSFAEPSFGNTADAVGMHRRPGQDAVTGRAGGPEQREVGGVRHVNKDDLRCAVIRVVVHVEGGHFDRSDQAVEVRHGVVDAERAGLGGSSEAGTQLDRGGVVAVTAEPHFEQGAERVVRVPLGQHEPVVRSGLVQQPLHCQDSRSGQRIMAAKGCAVAGLPLIALPAGDLSRGRIACHRIEDVDRQGFSGPENFPIARSQPRVVLPAPDAGGGLCRAGDSVGDRLDEHPNPNRSDADRPLTCPV